MWAVVSQTFSEFNEDECPRLAAATAYYTFFSLPALLVALNLAIGVPTAVDRAGQPSRLPAGDSSQVAGVVQALASFSDVPASLQLTPQTLERSEALTRPPLRSMMVRAFIAAARVRTGRSGSRPGSRRPFPDAATQHS